MADPILTTLCAICHVSPPKYKCPRCNIQTCSLGCIKKHKVWSECSGERDATAYVKPSKLRTPAGVDHDYNFLHGIEMSVERSERLLIGERGLVQTEELRPLTMQEVKWKTGRDGKKRKVVTTRVLREAKGRVFERFLAQRLKKLNVRILCAPMGMARQKENNTTLNRRSGRINWQVEWFALNQEEPTEHAGTQSKRLLSKVMDDTPLYQAYHDLLEERRCATTKNTGSKMAPRAKAHQSQSSSDSRWTANMDGLQDALTGMWLSPAEVDAEEDERRRQQYQFFLASTSRRSDLPTKMAKLDSGDCLREILRNGQVLEFPTLFVLDGGSAATLPPGFVLGPKESAAPLGTDGQGTKRKEGPLQGKGNDPRSAKKQRQQDGGALALEEGEVGSEEEAGEKSTAPSGDKSSAIGLEAGEVIGEESFGEEDGMDEDDETSSSGSDSE
ncbi:HIT zinc finger domain-containing protein [Sarocladium implicatum]|nr:HIT zinc finger domain-containing protein [Sarocladium implicatum]